MSPRPVRIAFAVVACLFLAAIVIQVFLAGVGLFMYRFSYHMEFGWWLPLGPFPVLLLAWAAGAGRTTIRLSVALLLLVWIQPFLPELRRDLPVAAALHPVNALAIFWLAFSVARRSLVVARQPTPTGSAATEIAEGAALRP